MAEKQKVNLRMIAWELTRRCNLACSHCRASSKYGPYANELTTDECFKLIDEIVSFSNPVIILTGGEPLLREDIFEIAEYGKKKGLRMVMAPNGTLLTDENVEKIIQAGIKRISVSLDGPDAATHDNLRQVTGAFNQACEGIARAGKAGLEFQINSTITKRNIKLLPQIMDLAKKLGAKAHHIFLLVPTGRAKDMVGEELSAAEYEETLKVLAKEKNKSAIEIKITCAPHLNRILAQEHLEPAATLTGRGCMAGVSFCFISHTGNLQPCGYLDIKCGNIREQEFKKSWLESEVFNNLRDFSKYKGKCGICEFRMVCAGCRARAYAVSKDYLAQEPYCVYKPQAKK
ncbi:MAG: radical SAM protein [Candidatus Omnitrophota bacterium]|nr:radical SAM protein [Candidatus Omnitrophota bacterium]